MSDEKKTVRVRIAVAVSTNAGWTAWGADAAGMDLTACERDAFDAQWARRLMGEFGTGYADKASVVFVEADVPLPSSPTVEGRVAQ